MPSDAVDIAPPDAVVATPPARRTGGPGLALLQVIVCSGVPTQLALASLLVLMGINPGSPTHPRPLFIAAVALGDTGLVLLLIRAFLRLSGETPRDVFLGTRLPGPEIALGAFLLPMVFVGLVCVIAGLRILMPALHNVPESPFENFFASPLKAALFIVVVVVAGGVREELQRGFILHRFRQSLGGIWVGLILSSVAFGAGHIEQGYDVAVAIGLVGGLWGWLYVRRGSVLASMTNHACFDVAQVLQQMLVRGLAS
jgi:membrane protease YdiL (CAAX protease family)